MKLTDTAIRNIKPGKKPKKKADGGGIYILVNPNGSRLWRFKYRFKGDENLLSFGAYPDVSLAQARIRRSAEKALLANGVDPSAHKKALAEESRQTAKGGFRLVAEDWLAFKSKGWAPESRRKAEYVIRT